MRKIYTAVFLGISLFAILGLALGPTLQTATAHNPGKLEEHCDLHAAPTPGFGCPGERGPGTIDTCTTKSGAGGFVHFIDIDSDGEHDHNSPGPNGEPTLCFRR